MSDISEVLSLLKKSAEALGSLDHSLNTKRIDAEIYEKRLKKALEGLKPEAPLVLYCEGVGCELSFFLGRELQGQGYKNIRIFYGGFPEWKDAGLPVEI